MYTAETGASFWSDDYTGEGPKGSTTRAIRRLSPFTSYLVGLRGIYTVTPAKGRIIGLISGLRFGITADMIQFVYSDFTLAGEPIGNARAWIFGLNAAVLF